MQIKSLEHARKLVKEGKLIAGVSLLEDKRGEHRLFLGLTRGGCLVTDSTTGQSVSVWTDYNIPNLEFTIAKPKKKIKLECWVGFDKKGRCVGVCEGVKEDYFNGTNTIHIEHICKEIEVEDE